MPPTHNEGQVVGFGIDDGGALHRLALDQVDPNAAVWTVEPMQWSSTSTSVGLQREQFCEEAGPEAQYCLPRALEVEPGTPHV